jgi:tetratricopeptide (TPR) repeat protein
MSEVLEQQAQERPLDAVRFARDRLNQGDTDEAERAARWALDHHPTHSGILSMLGEICARQGDLGAAIGWVKQALMHNEKDFAACLTLGNLYARRNDPDAAEAAYRDALAISPGDARALRRLSELAARRGNLRSAIALAGEALEARPDIGNHLHLSALHLRAGAPQAAEAVARAGVALFPGQPALLRRLSEVLSRLGDTVGAIKSAEDAIGADPNDHAAYGHLATLYLRNSDPVSAHAVVQAGLVNDPGNAALATRACDTAARSGDFGGMFGWAMRAMAARPDDAGAYLHLSHWHMRYGNLQAAGESLGAALVAAPGDVRVLRRSAELAIRLGDLAGAEHFLEQAILNCPGDPVSYEDASALYLQQGNMAKAYSVLREGLTHCPGDAGLQRRLAYLQALPRDAAPCAEPPAQGVAVEATPRSRRRWFSGLGRRTAPAPD